MAEAFTNAFDYDFIGFTYNKLHSIRDLGIYRVSNGSRYDNQIAPTLTENTMDIPGNDGMYFFGTYHKQKTFSINIAFDSMTESQLRKLRQLFNGKEIGELIFDETPYKAYSAKITGTPTIKVICFDELKDGKMQRVYKGEGTLQFVCYSPYAYTPDWCWSWNERQKKFEVKQIDGRFYASYPENTYPLKHQWKSGNMAEDRILFNDLDNPNAFGQNGITISTQENSIWQTTTNLGDLPCPFEITINHAIPAGSEIGFGYFSDFNSVTTTNKITILQDVSEQLVWDSKTGMVSQKVNNQYVPINFTGDSCLYFKPHQLVIFDTKQQAFDISKNDQLKFKFWYY